MKSWLAASHIVCHLLELQLLPWRIVMLRWKEAIQQSPAVRASLEPTRHIR